MSPTPLPQPDYLPMTPGEMKSLGWDTLDVLFVSGDAYVDHPSFGIALLGRWLVSRGFRVGIVAQPGWNSTDDLLVMGRPRLFVGISSGAQDSMLAHYTAFRKKRHEDAYSPGGKSGARPNRACLVYAGLVRRAFPGVTVILGGIEASLRRLSHYDFWSDKLRRSILLDSKADAVCYGMAEQTVLGLAQACSNDQQRSPLLHVARRVGGLVLAGHPEDLPGTTDLLALPSHEALQERPARLVEATLSAERQVHQGRTWLTQQSGDRTVIVSPPAAPLTTEQLDELYALPFSRKAHPSYQAPISAAEMIRWSVTTHRGCGGGCSFCTLALHQGRAIRSRSRESVVREVAWMTQQADWRGSLSDVGGPSANMWQASCRRPSGQCRRDSCLTPSICPHLAPNHGAQMDLLHTLAGMGGVNHVRVASGVRFDLALQNPAYTKALVQRYVGGQLKLAPEHCVEGILRLMRKPSFSLFERFLEGFQTHSQRVGKRQFVVPYLMSAFPGCTEADMLTLADWLRNQGWRPQQVQCFIPLPGTVAGAMYYSETDMQGRPIPVARTDTERLRQHHLLLGGDPKSSEEKKSSPKVSGDPGRRTPKGAKRPHRRRRRVHD